MWQGLDVARESEPLRGAGLRCYEISVGLSICSVQVAIWKSCTRHDLVKHSDM